MKRNDPLNSLAGHPPADTPRRWWAFGGAPNDEGGGREKVRQKREKARLPLHPNAIPAKRTKMTRRRRQERSRGETEMRRRRGRSAIEAGAMFNSTKTRPANYGASHGHIDPEEKPARAPERPRARYSLFALPSTNPPGNCFLSPLAMRARARASAGGSRRRPEERVVVIR